MKAALICIAIVLLPFPLSANDPPRIKILAAVVGSNDPLQVSFRTDGDMARIGAFGGGLLGYLAAESIRADRTSEFDVSLNRAVGDYSRAPVIAASIESIFERKYPVFDIEKSDRSSANIYIKGNDVDYGGVATAGFRYFLVVDDRLSGLWMLNAVATKTDDVAPTIVLRYRLYDVEQKKIVAKGMVDGYGLMKKPVREAVNDAPFFVEQYPAIVDTAVGKMIGALYRENHLHTLAATVGQGDRVLPLGQVVGRYEGRFTFEPKIPKDWRNVKMNSKYVHVVEPKSDERLKFGVRHDLDLLIPEFGQAVETVDDYMRVFFGRLPESGYDLSTIREFADLPTKNMYRAVVIDRPDKLGKEIVLFRIVDPLFVEVYSAIFIKDFDSLFPKYRDSIVAVVDNSKLTIRP